MVGWDVEALEVPQDVIFPFFQDIPLLSEDDLLPCWAVRKHPAPGKD